MADEFQDVDAQQYRLLRLLAGGAGNLCVIGDPDQAIYGFRGADSGCFARFSRDFPAARSLRLKANYRSTGTIVTAAAALMDAAAEGITRPMADPIGTHVASDETAEAAFVAAEIEALLGGHDLLTVHRASGRAGTRPLGFADCAVLYRTGAQAAALRATFDRAGIPFQQSTPEPIFGHPGVVAILDVIAEDGAGVELTARIAQAAEVARRRNEASPEALAEARGWLAALAASEAVAGDAAKLREQTALSTEADFRDARADRVSLLTMHAAKGLEFSIVFVVGMEAGLMPFSWNGAPPEDDAATQEERRLFYVAVTRARDRLFLTRAAERNWRGTRRTLPPSPFLADIPAGLIKRYETAARQRAKTQQLSLF